jgi:hypothetical protein
MAVAKWTALGTRSSNFAGTTLNTLANGSESATVTYDNSANKNLYGMLTLKLGSITPAAGGSMTLRITINDGTDTADKIGGDINTVSLISGAGAKIAIFPFIRLYPCSMRISLINSSGVTLNASGNEIYITPYNEDVS